MKRTLNLLLKLEKRKLKNRLIKGLCLSITILFISLCITPFQIYAQSVGGSSPIIGVNITYVGYDGEVVPYQTTVRFDTEQTMWRCTSSHSTMGCQVWESITSSGSDLDEITGTITTNATSTYTYRLYQYEFIFDKSYVGSITFDGNHPGATTTTTYYVNGDRLVLTDVNLVTSFTISSYSLTYAPLEVLDMMRQWDIPFESYPTISYALKNNFAIFQFRNLNDYQIPLFTSYKDDVIFRFNSCPTSVNERYDYYNVVIMMDRSPNASTMNSNLKLDDGQWVYESRLYEFNDGNKNWNIAKWHINGFQNAGANKITLNYTDLDYCILYFGPDESESLISTDFALQFNFQNQLLKDIHQMAQGTTESNSAATGLDSETSSFESVASGLYQSENSFNQNMNSSLQSIDTSFNPSTSFGSKFLYSADWVRSQFNTITSNTPFGSVLSFSMLLGLSLLIIGKVFK